MGSILLAAAVFVGYLIMYRVYGRFIGKAVFKISREAQVPSVQYEDGIDYVPTRKEIIFGHHFTSIAGTGRLSARRSPSSGVGCRPYCGCLSARL